MKKQTYNKDIESFAIYMYNKARSLNTEAKSSRPISKSAIIKMYHNDPLFKQVVDTQFKIKTEKDHKRKSDSFMKMVSENDYQEIQLKRIETLGPEGLYAARKKQIETCGGKGSKKLSDISKKGHETLGIEGRSARTKKGNETLGAEGRSVRSKKRAETIGFEMLSEISKKGRAKVPFDIKSTAGKKGQAIGAQSKRKKSDLLYVEILKKLPEIFTSKEAKDVLVKMGYKEARWIMMKKNCELIKVIPMIGSPNQYNPEKFKKI